MNIGEPKRILIVVPVPQPIEEPVVTPRPVREKEPVPQRELVPVEK